MILLSMWCHLFVGTILLLTPIVSAFSISTTTSRCSSIFQSSSIMMMHVDDDNSDKAMPIVSPHQLHLEDDNSGDKAIPILPPNHPGSTRRDILSSTAAFLIGTSPIVISPQPSLAVDKTNNNSNNESEGMVSQSKLASLLKRIPTFAIVDTNGVPYFVVGEDAKLTSYFFTSYDEAKRILDVANKSSDKAIKESKKELKQKNGGKLTKLDEEEIGINPWKSARITSVPLDLAVSLSSKGKLAGAYFKVSPSELDIEDALSIDGSDDLPEGKVPLFYIEDMTTVGNNGAKVSPLYFHKDELISEWKRQQKKTKYTKPDIKVTELFATITEMIRPDGKDEDLKTLEFVTPLDCEAKVEKCKKGAPTFRLGERLVVL